MLPDARILPANVARVKSWGGITASLGTLLSGAAGIWSGQMLLLTRGYSSAKACPAVAVE
jgi:hypothetical protein